MRKNKTSVKLSMQPSDVANYEAEARAYFDSVRQPFELTVESFKRNTPRFLAFLILLIMVLGILTLPFTWSSLDRLVFHSSTYTFFGKPRTVSDIAGALFLSCLGVFVALLLIFGAVNILEIRKARKLLPPRVMVFALADTIFRELGSSRRTQLSHHQNRAEHLWAKLLTYMRWTLQGSISPDIAEFHHIPVSDFPLALQAERVASALNWSNVAKREYGVIAMLNTLHQKLSPRIKNGQDLPLVIEVLQGIANFFYTTIVQSSDSQAAWGYQELLRASEIVNRLSAVAKPERAPFLSAKIFTHENPVIAFLAWWVVFQVLFILLLSVAFRFFPTLTMNSQAMVGLIAAPIAAAISMVGISRKSS